MKFTLVSIVASVAAAVCAVAPIEAPNEIRAEPPFSVQPPPPPAPLTPVRLHAGMQPPRKIVNVDPVYPRVAQEARIEGTVILETVIDVTGRVTSVRVLRSIPLLDQAAIDAVNGWTFTPTLLSGVPVPIALTVTVRFALSNR
jgi:periplasmic protein TonB